MGIKWVHQLKFKPHTYIYTYIIHIIYHMWFLSKNMRLWETPFHPLAYHHFPIKTAMLGSLNPIFRRQMIESSGIGSKSKNQPFSSESCTKHALFFLLQWFLQLINNSPKFGVNWHSAGQHCQILIVKFGWIKRQVRAAYEIPHWLHKFRFQRLGPIFSGFGSLLNLHSMLHTNFWKRTFWGSLK